MCTLLICILPLIPFLGGSGRSAWLRAVPRMRQGLGLAQEWGIGGEARCMVRATLQTCLWELTNCPRIWLGPLEHLPLPTDTFLSVPT